MDESPKTNALGAVETRTERQPENPSAIPAGTVDKSWALRQLRDTREDVIELIRGAQSVPEEARAFLVEAIGRTHSKSRLISVDAHCQVIVLPTGKVKHLGSWDISDL